MTGRALACFANGNSPKNWQSANARWMSGWLGDAFPFKGRAFRTVSPAGRAGKTQRVSRQLMSAPPGKVKPLLGGKGLRKLTTAAEYHALDLVQTPFGFVFWLIEQRKAWLQDLLANNGREQ